ELRRIFLRLGYEYEADTARPNIDYYRRRPSNGSALSFVTHPGGLAGGDPQWFSGGFTRALGTDNAHAQRGPTTDGVHGGVMSGTLDVVQRLYLGAEVRGEVLHFSPRLIERLEGLSMAMQFRGTDIRVTVEGGRLTVLAAAEGASQAIKVCADGEVRELA